MTFESMADVLDHFKRNKPFLDGIRGDHEGIFFIESIRMEMYKELISGMECNILKDGEYINTGESFSVNLRWKNNVAKINDFSFDLDFNAEYVRPDPADQPIRIKAPKFGLGQVLERSWTFKAIKDSLTHDDAVPGFYSMDGTIVNIPMMKGKEQEQKVGLVRIGNIMYAFDPVDAMNFLFSSPAEEVLLGRGESIITDVVQPEDGPD